MNKNLRIILSLSLAIGLGISTIACSKNSSSEDKSVAATTTSVKSDVNKNSSEASKNDSSEKETLEKEANNNQPIKEFEVSVKEKVIKDETDAISIDMRYPIVSGLDDKNIEDKINKTLEEDALNFKKSLEKEATDAHKSMQGSEIEFRKYEAKSLYEVKYNKNNILSIPVLYYQYTGGAHGGSILTGYNFDLTSGKLIGLAELFDSSFDYKKVISAFVIDQIKVKEADYFPEAIGSIQGSMENRPYYIEDGNLVIYYTEYEIAPYAAGVPKFKIPFSTLKFNDKFQLK